MLRLRLQGEFTMETRSLYNSFVDCVQDYFSRTAHFKVITLIVTRHLHPCAPI